jgi:hypothetical protein
MYVNEGGLCGATCLDLGFKQYIRTRIGEDQYDEILAKWPERVHSMLVNWECSIKTLFGEDGPKQYSVDLYGIKEKPGLDIQGPTIRILRLLYLPANMRKRDAD